MHPISDNYKLSLIVIEKIIKYHPSFISRPSLRFIAAFCTKKDSFPLSQGNSVTTIIILTQELFSGKQV